MAVENMLLDNSEINQHLLILTSFSSFRTFKLFVQANGLEKTSIYFLNNTTQGDFTPSSLAEPYIVRLNKDLHVSHELIPIKSLPSLIKSYARDFMPKN